LEMRPQPTTPTRILRPVMALGAESPKMRVEIATLTEITFLSPIC